MNLYDLANYFELKLQKYGAPPKLPLSPPGRKIKEEIKQEPKKEYSKIDYLKLKDLIIYVSEAPYTRAVELSKKIELLEKVSKLASSAAIKLAHKVKEVGDKEYQNTTQAEEELGELLNNYLTLNKNLKGINDDINFYSSSNSTDSNEHLKEIEKRVKEFAKR